MDAPIGAVQASITFPALNVAIGFEVAGSPGLMAFEGLETSPCPASVIAATRNTYVSPFVSPGSVVDVIEDLVLSTTFLQVLPASVLAWMT
jgi:hypothetical protein